MSQIVFRDLKRWYSLYTDQVEEMIDITADLWEKFHLFPKQCKSAIDEISHPNLVPSSDPIVMKCKEILTGLADNFGIFSPVYQSITKMIIDCELSSTDIRKEIKAQGTLPAAFTKSLVAHPSFEMWPVVSFIDDIFDSEYESDPAYANRYINVLRLRRFLEGKSKIFFERRNGRRRLIRLSNGSSTRIEDEVNVQDLNGSIYVTEEEVKLIESMKPLLDWLHIDNFEDGFQFLETVQVADTYGSVNYAPDDSGKTRISFLIDSCIQVVSKAVHEYLDYLVKDLSCNGTYRQQSVIRNMIKKGRNYKKGVIISTDMSKYSDTMQRSYMLQVLEWIGIPKSVIKCMDTLYSLPLWDSVLKRITGSTDASYQGQYGDFPWITLMNIFSQLACYDFVNYTYGTKYHIDLRLKRVGKSLVCRNDMNCAVGDDTILAFPGWDHKAEELFEIVQAAFNRIGVNINLSKTHWIQDGEGCCDFVKRFITKDGLVPYIRIQAAVSISFDERCEEMLRFYRDNIIDKEDWDSLVDCFLPPDYADPLKKLHLLNGGIVDSVITGEDLKMFYLKNTVYSRAQSLRNKDEIRKWIDMVHRCYNINLIDTHLISFLVQEIKEGEELEASDEVLWDSEECNDCDWSREVRELTTDFEDKINAEYGSWEEVRSTFSEEELVQAILNTMTRGYRYPDFENISRIIGEFLDTALDKFEDFRQFFFDYQQNEIYRYLYSNSSRQLDVYTRMFKYDHSWLIERNDIYRYPLDRMSTDCGRQLFSVVEKRALREGMIQDCTYWGVDYRYLWWENRRYRMYQADRTSYSIPPKSAFLYLLGYDAMKLSEEERKKTDDLWNDFWRYLC